MVETHRAPTEHTVAFKTLSVCRQYIGDLRLRGNVHQWTAGVSFLEGKVGTH